MRAGLIGIVMMVSGAAMASDDPRDRARNAAIGLLVLSHQCEPALDDPGLFERAVADTWLTMEAGGFTESETRELLDRVTAARDSEAMNAVQAPGFCRAFLGNIMENRDAFRAKLRG